MATLLSKMKQNPQVDNDLLVVTHRVQPMFLCFDYETSGIGDFKKQKAIQLAWVLCDKNYKKIGKIYSLYFDDVTEINTEFHKNLTVQSIKKIAVPAKYILDSFLNDCNTVMRNNGLIIAHNIEFDYQILQNECKRQKINYHFDIMRKHLFCTMKTTTNLCKLKSHGGQNKYPRLVELYKFLHNKIPELELHEASNDVEVLYRCFATLNNKYKFKNYNYIC